MGAVCRGSAPGEPEVVRRRGPAASRPVAVMLGLLVGLASGDVSAQPSPPTPPGGASAAPAPDALEPDTSQDRARPADTGADASPPDRLARIRYALSGIDIRGNVRTADRVVLRYVPFRAGDVLDVADPELELTRFRLLGTGFFSEARLSLRRGKARGQAVLVIDVVERNTLVVQNVYMGIAADEDTEGNAKPLSPYLGVQAAETNLAGTGITLGAGVGVAADQWALRAEFADPAFAGTSWSVHAALQYHDARDFFGNRDVSFESPLLELREVTDYAVVSYRRFGGRIGAGHDLLPSTKLVFDYRLEQIEALVPTIASHVRGATREPLHFDIIPGGSVLSALQAALVYDTRDAPFLTTRGTHAYIRAGLGLPPLGSSYAYQKVEIGYQRWFRLPWNHIVSVQGLVGAIAGDAPFFEKFYVGDFTDLLPDRILELNPDRRQPPNYLGTDIIEVRYGDYAARLQGEYRVPLYSGRDAIYGIDFFTALGLYGVASRRELTDPPSGYEGAEQVPIDLTYNLGLRFETYVGGFSLAFSNLLGLLPARGGGRK